MFKIHKKFLLCRRYEKDVWGYLIAKHKTFNLGRIKVWPNIENVPHLVKSKWLLQDFSKKLNSTWFKGLNFSFEIIRWMKKRWPWKMKNRMRFFFLAWILRIFYGNLRRQTFKNLCNTCLARNASAVFSFIQIFEYRLPTFIYWIGFAPSFISAQNWISKGFILVNNKIEKNNWWLLKLYDFVSFKPEVWSFITDNLSRMFYYGSKATWRRRCTSTRIWALEKIAWAHFISFPDNVEVNSWIFSFYLWKELLPTKIWFYFSLNLSNILKFVTI